MPEPAAELETPLLLIAMPQVVDPFFHRAVVLLMRHTDEGSFGVIVNRPTDVTVQDVLAGMEIDWEGSDTEPAYFGGPVLPQAGSVLFLPLPRVVDPETTQPEDQELDLGAGMRLTHHVHRLADLAAKPPPAFRLFLGHSGWGEGQLVEEILRNDWLIAPVSHELVFANDPSDVWERTLESVGVDPATLPSWTGEVDEETTN
jgi:putative transcriptional regulator